MKKIFYCSVLAMVLMLTGCRPDENEARRKRVPVPEGIDAMLSLKWTQPAMEENEFQLCSPVSEERARAVEDIWIGIYNARTGECTANYFLALSSTADEHAPQAIPNLKTLSGESYIVAAANVRNNPGVSSVLNAGDTVRLSVLLQKADTWAKYKSISAVLPEPDEVTPTRHLVMAGSFHKGGADAAPAGGWSDGDGNPETVAIAPGMNGDLDGYIHLRRLFAYNRFTIAAGPNVNVELQNWQVCNLPLLSYLQERKSENAADVFTKFREKGLAGYEDNHGTMPVSHIFEQGDAEGEYVFDFYQYENKHTGLAKNGDVGVADYQDREREWKNGAGGNTGVYKSLCATADQPVPGLTGQGGVNTNNYASYVVIKATVSYYVKGDDIDNPSAPALPGPEPGAVLRTGNAVYTIHLGYCEGKGVDLARDFNVRRNNWYEYRVQINGLKSIGLEAASGTTENQPGAEGEVFNVTHDSVIEVDAHNGVFNIRMTNADRENLQWIVSAPYGSTVHTLTLDTYGHETPDLRQNQFYNWIRFKPAPSADLLAVYKENEGEPDADLWTLEDLRDVVKHPGMDENGVTVTDPDDQTPRWYTVFVKEYAYEGSADERGGNWKQYVNKPSRVVYLNTKAKISADKESIYMTPQYTIVQNSIQTYYDIYASMPAALGVERENECYGLNMRWTDAVRVPAGGWNSDNGRWNAWHYAGNKSWYGGDGILDDKVTVGGRSFLRQAETPAVKRQGEDKAARMQPAYRLKALPGGGPAEETDPSDANEFYEYMAVCLNRNRDENGNGRIDKDELKWYLATSGKYLRIVLGRESLDEPLMHFGVDIAANSGSGTASRHHYAASDGKMIWAEEGVSSSGFIQNGRQLPWPWQVRCVRNLGVDFSEVVDMDPVPAAYQVDVGRCMVYFDYYDKASIRRTQRGTMPVHRLDDRLNMAPLRLEYAQEDCRNIVVRGTGFGNYDIGVNEDGKLTEYGSLGIPVWGVTDDILQRKWEASVAANKICGQYKQAIDGSDRGTWRVPNQVELTILSRLGIFQGDGNWLSCTREYYDNGTGVSNAGTRYISAHRGSDGAYVTLGAGDNFRLRCVRDVE